MGEQKRVNLILVLLVLLLSSCVKPAQYVAPNPGESWIPGPEPKYVDRLDKQLKPQNPPLDQFTGENTLTDLIDIALRNNPDSRFAWAEAHAAAANWAKVRGEYFPTLDASGEAGYQKTVAFPRNGYGQVDLTSSYLLLDFGGRSGASQAAREALIAANWNYNQTILDIFRDVIQAYYRHLGDKAKVSAYEKNLQEALTSLNATELRRKAGVSTIADVLQARSNAAEVKVNLIAARNEVNISRGALATVVGWPANTRLRISKEPERYDFQKIRENVDTLISEAKEKRPELKSSVANLREKEAELKKAKSAMLPELNAQGDFGWQKVGRFDATNYQAGVNLSIPIFRGTALRNAVRQAEAELEAARSSLRKNLDTIISEVWDSYYNYITANGQLQANKELMASATESFKVSLGRYKAGVADIVELLDAQTTLAKARAQLVDSRMNVYISYAELVHAVGRDVPERYRPRNEGFTIQEKEIRETSYGERE